MKKYHRRFGALVALLAIGTVACGDGDTSDEGASAGRTIKVSMTDNSFKPTEFEVKAGEEIRFQFRNDGKAVHEAIIGDTDKQADHEAEMKAKSDDDGDDPHMGDNEHGGRDDDALTLDPGESGELTHKFEDSGEILLGCHEPGHYDAGMKATITVK